MGYVVGRKRSAWDVKNQISLRLFGKDDKPCHREEQGNWKGKIVSQMTPQREKEDEEQKKSDGGLRGEI